MKKIEIRAIRSQKQYQEYLAEIDMLMNADPSPKSAEGKVLETLTLLVEDYEKKKGWEIPIPENPVQLIVTRMEHLGLKQSDLVSAVGDKTVVSRILSGSRKLTYSMINPLSKLLKVPPELLLERS
jgi:HTH-type transcriptional regulator/antitoxin HigA